MSIEVLLTILEEELAILEDVAGAGAGVTLLDEADAEAAGTVVAAADDGLAAGAAVVVVSVVVGKVHETLDFGEGEGRSLVHISATHWAQGRATCRSASLSWAKSRLSNSICDKRSSNSAASVRGLDCSASTHCKEQKIGDFGTKMDSWHIV